MEISEKSKPLPADGPGGSWGSPVPEERWRGFRSVHRGHAAFSSRAVFEEAAASELENSLKEHERQALGRLLERGQKAEIELFLRTHGANPISDPQAAINVPVRVAKADVVDLESPPSPAAIASYLNGEVVYVLFQAGEASRFNRGPLLQLNPLDVAREVDANLGLGDAIARIESKRRALPTAVGDFLAEGPLGPKQGFLIRAGIRRIVQLNVDAGRLSPDEAPAAFQRALKKQRVLFFVGRQRGVNEAHDAALRETYRFFGFDPANVITVEQELARGLTADTEGRVSIRPEETARDAAGHLYAFLQATRKGGFVTYDKNGRPVAPSDVDALTYLESRGAKYLSIVRINDMDRHSVEIANPKSLSYALARFEDGYANVIEGVSNPSGQKGGTGIAFNDPGVHVLTETHENSYPALSRAMEAAMKAYLEESKGRHPAYNAMRQWALLDRTRDVLVRYGARIVFVPRQKAEGGKAISYVGVDMPMGDLSLFVGSYPSRMFQFATRSGRELEIHDMKKKEDLGVALRAIERQLDDPLVVAAAREFFEGSAVPFKKSSEAPPIYGAPAPELE